MILGLNILIIACSLLGIIVCVKGVKTKNIIYRGGVYFFTILLIERVYSLIVPIYIQNLIDQGVDNPGLWVRNSAIPPLLFIAIALIILITFFIRGLNKKV